ncbi:galactosyltransferase-associated protein kinase [Capsaspora owczarzaki ATCC 30864]|uniref:galactosyltransferase-associated protein kinase n=1 Tax=Capsaspora owczarzaki (strain ATCC 30864) TaxID=595528 RepID=UPI0001FE2C3D|nr:galactosyltransferase-associated protein kinase [Capsaspora owczarzaki ATCC 30864]|eukprot:XP_004343309.1 galactosyltransferase-associated protein kinase [Capsaspora owczarzaki ATCC 30864]
MPATRPAVRASSMLNPATAAAATATAASRAASSAPEHPPAASVPPTASAPVPAPAHAPAATAPPSGSHSHHQRPRPPTDLKPYEPKHRPFPFCRSLAEFDKGNKVGDGQFGEVFRAYDKLHNNRPVALKSVKMQEEQEGFPITSVREIKILRWQSSHENIVRLYDLVREESRDKRPETFYLCFEFMDCDLEALIKTPTVVLSSGIIKCYVKQIMTGLNHMHLNNVVHRDLKAANILINNRGQLKLGDFGLARVLLEKKNKDMEGGYTNRVVTLWYRCPELLLGDTAYNTAIDMWSVGCIVYEMYTRSTLFREESEMAMLRKIIELCGSPAGESWPDVEKLPNFKDVSGLNCKRRVREALNSKIQDLEAVNLIDCLLTLNPAKRYSATQCLDHDYFWKSPLPLKPEESASRLKCIAVRHTHLAIQGKPTVIRGNPTMVIQRIHSMDGIRHHMPLRLAMLRYRR